MLSHKIITTIIQGTITTRMSKTIKDMTSEGTSVGMITIIMGEFFRSRPILQESGEQTMSIDPMLYMFK